MAAKTAIEVAEMESEVTLLRNELNNARVRIELLTQERDTLRNDLVVAQNAAKLELVRATTMESIMQQVSSGLIAGLRKMESERSAERNARRLAQEQQLEVGSDKSLDFLKRREEEAVDEEGVTKEGATKLDFVEPTHALETDQDRIRAIAGLPINRL